MVIKKNKMTSVLVLFKIIINKIKRERDKSIEQIIVRVSGELMLVFAFLTLQSWSVDHSNNNGVPVRRSHDS